MGPEATKIHGDIGLSVRDHLSSECGRSRQALYARMVHRQRS